MTRVIFLPGHLCTERLWEAQIAALADVAQCKVSTLFGADSVATMAKHVLDHAPERFSLAGLSMGGYVAFEILRQAPQRIERLALFNTTARPDPAEALEIRKADMQLAADHGMRALTQKLYSRWLYREHAASSALQHLLDQMAESVGPINQRLQQKAIIERPDSRRTLQGIHCPTLVVGGLDDHVTPPFVHEEMAALVRGAELHLIEKCGHLSPLEQPAIVSRLLRDWLTRY